MLQTDIEENSMEYIGPIGLGVIILLIWTIFGAGLLRQVGHTLGKHMRGFRTHKAGEVHGINEPGSTEEKNCLTMTDNWAMNMAKEPEKSFRESIEAACASDSCLWPI
jgi:Sec-independent protein translocase protein TatA